MIDSRLIGLGPGGVEEFRPHAPFDWTFFFLQSGHPGLMPTRNWRTVGIGATPAILQGCPL